ncbi:MAG: hypothetical protein AAGD14_02705 [Planctomycetota bacterium]
MRIALCLFVVVSVTAAEDSREDWPRLLGLDNNERLVVHEPQVEEWAGFKLLTFRAAINLEGQDGSGEPTESLGTVRVRLRTAVDLHRGVALASDPEVLAVEGVPEARREAVAKRLVREIKSGSPEIDLEDLLGELDRSQYPIREVAISTEPPRLIIEQQPAILIAFDGEPKTAAIPGTDLRLAMNSPSLLFQQAKTGWWYMYGWDTWIKTRSIQKGPWVPAPTLPSTFQKLPDNETWRGLKERIPGRKIERKDVPKVHYATKPTELVVIYGTPKFVPIPETSLSVIENTEADVLLDAKTGQYYTLLSGRWFRARGPKETLEFCTDKLPEDFRKIPTDHLAARVRVHVPGTPEAEESLLLHAVPRVATVRRGDVKLEIPYKGVPKFVPVEGTSLEYAINIGVDVFRIDGRVYCCSDGLWFTAEAARGPWTLCDKLPEAFARIPEESPAYFVSYCTIERSDADSVTFAYTPGYFGTFANRGVVVYGSGFTGPWPDEYRQAGWDSRAYWLQRWRRDDLHQWDRHLPYGEGRWYDPISGVYRRSYDAISHAKFRTHRADAFRTWNGKAVLPEQERRMPEPEPKPEKKKKTRVAKSRQQLYAGPDGEVYKHAHGVWFKNVDGDWRSLSRRPTLKQDVDRRKKLEKQRKARARSYNQRRRYRGYRSRRWRGFIHRPIWGGGIIDIGDGGCWGGAGWGGGAVPMGGFGGW